MPAAIDTARVADRRRLHFNSIDDVLADIDRIVAADKAGTLRCTGNWTAGQTLGHLAAWIDYGWDGYPMRVPWFIRLILKRKARNLIAGEMPSGVRIPGTEAGTYGVEVLTTDDGAARLRKALSRLKDREPTRFDSPAFGPMSYDDRIALNLRHAELHLSFLHP
jgi:hypothetical protein